MVVAGGGAGSVRPAPVSRSPRTVFPMAARGTGRRALPSLHAGRGGRRANIVRDALPPLQGSRRTFRRVRPTRPSEARHNARDHQSPDSGPLRNPDRLALSLFALLIHAVFFGFPVPLNGVSRTTRSVATMRARRDAAGSRRGGVRRDRRGDLLRPPAWIGAGRPPRGWAADPRPSTSP